MARNLKPIKTTKFVKVLCVDTNKEIEGTLITENAKFIVVDVTNGLRLSLQKHDKVRGLYTGKQSGLTFECNILD